MSSYNSDREDTTIYKVVVNHEEQYSIWPAHKENPPGWFDAEKTGPKDECLAYIKEVWTDMRPLSLRKRMEEMAKNPPAHDPGPDMPREKSLVDRLCEGDHRVEVGLYPDKSAEHFKDAIERNYVHIKFTETKGETELGVNLVKDACEFDKADFESGQGMAHLEGTLTLSFVKVRCIADIDLATLEGRGRLVKVADAAG